MGISESSELGTTWTTHYFSSFNYTGLWLEWGRWICILSDCCKTFGNRETPLEMTPLRFKPISILKVTNQFWQDWHARGMWWLGEQAERNSWPGYHLSPGQHRKERVLLVVNCCSVVGVWLWLAVGCALFFFLFDCLALWLHIPFASICGSWCARWHTCNCHCSNLI